MTFCASKTVNGMTTNHIWDDSNIVAETDGNKQVTAKYYRGSGLISQEVSNTESYYQFNMHGDVIGLTGANGELIEDYDYDAFGNQINQSTEKSTPFRYNGEYYDEETGFTYLRARYYDPTTGRFIQEDPIKDGSNWYTYCVGNPVNYFDSNGLWMEGDEKLSDGAQIYTKYYGDKWEEANKRYQSAIAIGDISGAEAAKLEMQDLHALAEDIRALDAEGKVSGVYYDIPLFNQGRYNLCWAYCQVMIENFMAGNSMSQEQADARAQTIAEYVNGTGTNPDGSFVWNKGGWPTNSKDIKNQMVTFPQIDSFSKLEKVIASNPAYAYYANNKNVAHLIVVTGVASAPGHDELVTTNNPWGEKNIQTYDDFKAGIPGDGYKMKLIDILRI